MLQFVNNGGIMMYPLLLFSFTALLVIIEKSILFIIYRPSPDKMNLLLSGKKSVTAYSQQKAFTHSPLGELLRLLESINAPDSLGENKLKAFFLETDRKLSRRIWILELIGKTSPMIGLTGTVIGLSRSFAKLEALGNLSDPSKLAGGIWVALTTTIFGLFIAVPCIIAAHIFIRVERNYKTDLIVFARKYLSVRKHNEL